MQRTEGPGDVDEGSRVKVVVVRHLHRGIEPGPNVGLHASGNAENVVALLVVVEVSADVGTNAVILREATGNSHAELEVDATHRSQIGGELVVDQVFAGESR